MTVKHSARIAADPDLVAKTLCSQEYNEANQRAREDNVDVRYELVEETDRGMAFDVFVTSYKRKKTGAIDRSGTEKTVTHYTYTASNRLLHWQHEGETEKSRVNVFGDTRVSPDGSGARVDREVTIDIRIPVIGRGIAKIVSREFEKGIRRSQGLLERIVAEKS